MQRSLQPRAEDTSQKKVLWADFSSDSDDDALLAARSFSAPVPLRTQQQPERPPVREEPATTPPTTAASQSLGVAPKALQEVVAQCGCTTQVVCKPCAGRLRAQPRTSLDFAGSPVCRDPAKGAWSLRRQRLPPPQAAPPREPPTAASSAGAAAWKAPLKGGAAEKLGEPTADDAKDDKAAPDEAATGGSDSGSEPWEPDAGDGETKRTQASARRLSTEDEGISTCAAVPFGAMQTAHQEPQSRARPSAASSTASEGWEPEAEAFPSRNGSPILPTFQPEPPPSPAPAPVVPPEKRRRPRRAPPTTSASPLPCAAASVAQQPPAPAAAAAATLRSSRASAAAPVQRRARPRNAKMFFW
eukprot:TRINITY_DN8996_c0_g1_i3.p1 TRINITY_DN8996_c0_g1~~TRINITY_DN8996_c0_g1_i3.p1  ORF type:complete len:358 (+),score=82.70 TRINITY_DN8996_c0_g1_i3:161-1234(+)